MSESAPTYDVHAHLLPERSLPLLAADAPEVHLETVDGVAGSVTVGGMRVGATIEQLSSLEIMLADMDAAGIDHRVLSPPPFTFRYFKDPQSGLELCRVLNDEIAAAVARHPDRLLGLCTVPLQDPDLAIEEFRRATDDLGLRGVEVSASVGESHLADRRFEDFFVSVADAGLPVLVHPDFVPSYRWRDYYLINLMGLTVETAACIANIAFSGMLERIPHLRICFVHGGGAAPYLFGRWIRGWELREESRKDLEGSVADSLGLMYFDTLTHSATALSFLVESVGTEHVVLGTDYPFDVRNSEPVRSLDPLGLEPDQRRQVESDSAQRWLGTRGLSGDGA